MLAFPLQILPRNCPSPSSPWNWRMPYSGRRWEHSLDWFSAEGGCACARASPFGMRVSCFQHASSLASRCSYDLRPGRGRGRGIARTLHGQSVMGFERRLGPGGAFGLVEEAEMELVDCSTSRSVRRVVLTAAKKCWLVGLAPMSSPG